MTGGLFGVNCGEECNKESIRTKGLLNNCEASVWLHVYPESIKMVLKSLVVLDRRTEEQRKINFQNKWDNRELLSGWRPRIYMGI